MERLQQKMAKEGHEDFVPPSPPGDLPMIPPRLVGHAGRALPLPLPLPAGQGTVAGGAPPPPPPPGGNPVPATDPEKKGPPGLDELSKRFNDMMEARTKAENEAKNLKSEVVGQAQTIQQQQQQMGQDAAEKTVLHNRLNLAGAQATHLADHVKLAETRI